MSRESYHIYGMIHGVCHESKAWGLRRISGWPGLDKRYSDIRQGWRNLKDRHNNTEGKEGRVGVGKATSWGPLSNQEKQGERPSYVRPCVVHGFWSLFYEPWELWGT